MDQKEFQHSEVCLEAKSVNRTTKKSFIRKRGEFEDKMMEDYITGTVGDNVKVKMMHYRAGFAGVKRLQKEYPRRHNQKTQNTTLGKKELSYHLDEFLNLLKNKKKTVPFHTITHSRNKDVQYKTGFSRVIIFFLFKK